MNNNFDKCGVEKLTKISKYKILNECSATVNVMEWVLTDQQGINKKIGKFNTQLELDCSALSVKQVIIKIVAQLIICCQHQCQ